MGRHCSVRILWQEKMSIMEILQQVRCLTLSWGSQIWGIIAPPVTPEIWNIVKVNGKFKTLNEIHVCLSLVSLYSYRKLTGLFPFVFLGHFGVIKFPYPMINPYYLSEVVQILNKICPGCKSIRKDLSIKVAYLIPFLNRSSYCYVIS